jgi:hypothetical protein
MTRFSESAVSINPFALFEKMFIAVFKNNDILK